MIKKFILSFGVFCSISVYSDEHEQRVVPYSIGYSIPAVKVVQEIPQKDRDFAFINPYDTKTYIYDTEESYYQDYQRSYFGVTSKKAGWDCLRHYEILGNGCIPYFVDLDQCDSKTLFHLPKELIWEAMHLEGVSYMHIDHTRFNHKRYYEILEQLLAYTRAHLTSEKMSAYLLETLNYSGQGKILVLSQNDRPEYLRDMILIGLKGNLQDRIVDVPKIPHVYKNYPGDIKKLYGKGMSYTKLLQDLDIDRENIAERIKNREFDLILYAEIHKLLSPTYYLGLPFYDLVSEYYHSNEIAYVYGDELHMYLEDPTQVFYPFQLPNLFVRENWLYELKKRRYFPAMQ